MPIPFGQRARNSLTAVAATVILGGTFASAAGAATEHFYNGVVGAQRVRASLSANFNPYYVQVVAANTKCPGLVAHMAGALDLSAVYGSGNFWSYGPCGTGTAGYYPSAHGTVHGAIFNTNVSTDANVTDSHYSW